MNRPAYVYLLWIGGNGTVTHILGGQAIGGIGPSRSSPSNSLSLPPEVDRGWPMSGDAGMESIVLLARDAPLPPSVDLESVVAGLQPQKMQSPNSLVEFEGGRR